MSYEPKSLEDQIDCLARITGAPETFVSQVKELFGKKGISMAEDAAPYVQALEEAFRREESIRFSTLRAKQNISTLQQHFRKIGRAYVTQISQLRKVQSSLKSSSGRLQKQQDNTTQITIKGDHRTFVTRTEREELPLVPGPEELQ